MITTARVCLGLLVAVVVALLLDFRGFRGFITHPSSQGGATLGDKITIRASVLFLLTTAIIVGVFSPLLMPYIGNGSDGSDELDAKLGLIEFRVREPGGRTVWVEIEVEITFELEGRHEATISCQGGENPGISILDDPDRRITVRTTAPNGSTCSVHLLKNNGRYVTSVWQTTRRTGAYP